MYIKLGFRNILRNKKRSLLAGLAIGVGLAALIFIDAFFIGIFDNMIRNITDSYLGHGQIHHKEFLQTLEIDKTIQNPQKILLKLSNNPDIQTATPRVMSVGMVSSAEDAKNIMIIGILPDKEKKVSQVAEQIIDGKFVSSEQDIILGKRLTDSLGVSVGDRVVLTASQKDSGELSQELFRVTGIFKMGTKEMDEKMAIIHIKKAQRLLSLSDNFHELAFRFHDKSKVDSIKFWQNLTTGTNEALSWKKLAPGIESFISLNKSMRGIISIILLALVSLGIMNTLFMSLYERLFEFGVLRALGTRSLTLILTVLSEAAALSFISIILGSIIALTLGIILSIVGIDYTGIELAGVTFREKIYVVLTWQQFVRYPIMIFCFTLLVSLYPSIHATKITLGKALKKTL